MIAVFVLGYLAIALEHPIKVDKAASALFTGMVIWVILVFTTQSPHESQESLVHHLFDISSILFFLLGAMTIVEVVDTHNGFSIITDRIKTRDPVRLAWIIGFVTFFLSAALDNLTTSIVMISLLRKLVPDQKTRWLYGGLIIIAANAGGAWSPIGDVTTTMLWIKGQLPDSLGFIQNLLIPSLATLLVPLIILTFTLRKSKLVIEPKVTKELTKEEQKLEATRQERLRVFLLGIGGLLFVPFFKQITHLPPFMAMMFSLSVLWISTEIMHRKKPTEFRNKMSVLHILRRIDTASILFFLGILMAVAGLQQAGHLAHLAMALDSSIGNIYGINILIGLLSAIIDNVPLVAAAQGMYDIAATGPFAANGNFWDFLAYCAGTGGSCLIIGSAAGVAVMGLEKIDFIWYMKRISILALAGYFAGAGVYLLMHT
ncbi:MAG: sodium:proton antiporter NhaD [Saprospiraceae bacterium]|nr:sodium:proton antiporter NhaD [Saprospiraceae bacterium]